MQVPVQVQVRVVVRVVVPVVVPVVVSAKMMFSRRWSLDSDTCFSPATETASYSRGYE